MPGRRQRIAAAGRSFAHRGGSAWSKVLNRYSIKPVQQFAYTTGKNATDSTIIIDAMDLLYTRRFDGYCLVTSDSDFTGLALRLREEGFLVYGFGEQKTPEAFRNACHEFIFTEVLRKPVAAAGAGASTNGSSLAAGAPEAAPAPATAMKCPAFPTDFLMEALEKLADDSGWAHLGTFGSYLQKTQLDFRQSSAFVNARLGEWRVGAAGVSRIPGDYMKQLVARGA